MPDRAVAVARSYQRQQVTLAERVAAQVGKLWDTVGGMSDDELAVFVSRAADLVAAAQVQTGSLTATYIDNYVQAAGGPPTPGLRPVDPITEPLRGVDLGTVYERPVVAARIARSQGATLIDALSVGRDRAVQTADTDVMIAARANAKAIMAQIPRIVGYRRVPDAAACMFCLLASTQRYKVGDLMPIHPKCHCTVAPIYGTKDPGRVLNKDLSKRLQADGVGAKSTAHKIADSERALINERAKLRQTRSQILAETDPDRLERLKEREAKWDQRVTERRARIAELNAEKGARLTGTPEVAQHPELGPVLTRALGT